MFSYERHGGMVFFHLRAGLRKSRAFNALLSFMRQTSEVSHNIYTQLPFSGEKKMSLRGKNRSLARLFFTDYAQKRTLEAW